MRRKKEFRCSEMETSLFATRQLTLRVRRGPARRLSSCWRRETRGDPEKPPARLPRARPERSYPSRAGAAAAARLPFLGRRRLRSQRRPFLPPTRCPWTSHAAAPSGGGREDASEGAGPVSERRQPAGSRASAESALRAPSPCSPSRPGTAVPTPATAAAASARIRARLGYRAIITGARGDVTRTPAPPPPPRGVLENCGARAPRTRAHTRRSTGAARAP